MPILLNRVDERLIHGQVVIGWGSHLRPERYLVVDDDLAASDWEQDLYRLGAGDAVVEFLGVPEARDRLAGWGTEPPRSILLTRDVQTMLALARGGLMEGQEVNLGGIHHGPDRRQVLTYLHLTEADRQAVRELTAEGVRVSARDLPDAHRVGVDAILAP